MIRGIRVAVYSRVRRATAFAMVATIALATPALGAAAAVPFALLAVMSRVISSGPLFDLFARPADRNVGQLRGLTWFALAATGLALLVGLADLPTAVFVGTVLLVGFGNLAETVGSRWRDGPMDRALAFLVGGAAASVVGQVAVDGASLGGASTVIILGVIGGILGALVRTGLEDPGDAIVMITVALPLWLLASLRLSATPTDLAVALAITGVFGFLSRAMGSASVTGMLTGVLVALLSIVAGGYDWFAVLIAFFAVGAVATKFRYEEKRKRGAAEANEGARGTGNVLANSSIALVAVLGFAASPALAIDPDLFVFAFTGSLATAMSDTLSSEIGVLYGEPRLITSMEPVRVGTDGGISWQGEVAGLAGAATVAILSNVLLGLQPVGAAVIIVAGMVGMTMDSLLGATIEGRVIGNQAVNLLGTFSGALAAVLGGLAFGAIVA